MQRRSPLQRRRAPLLLVALAAAVGVAGCSGGASAGTTSRPAPHSSTAKPKVQPAATADQGPTCPSGAKATVRTASALRQALVSAVPGSVIVLAPGVYTGHFVASAVGTATAPITLCGPASAILDGGSTHSGYVLHLASASWWRVLGFTVRDGQKGVMTDHAQHNLIAGLTVSDIGDEAIHLRAFSSDNTVQANVVSDTGHEKTKYGEGIYVGSANSNWCSITACKPDASDRNVIAQNTISDTSAENIDIKEGTTGGSIVDNTLSGVGMAASAATAWINVKGNSWTVSGNHGSHSNKDGFQVHQVYPGWGLDNTFTDNTAAVDGPGYGYYVQSKKLGTTVTCNNVETGAASGLSNLPCSG
jgi:hypothetical protein